jgi:hypothetical protein
MEDFMPNTIQLVLTYTLKEDGITWSRHIAAPGNEAAVKEWQDSKANGDVAKLMRKLANVPGAKAMKIEDVSPST